MRRVLIFLFFLLFCTNLYSLSFEEFKNAQNLQFSNYKNNLNKEFEAYKKAYNDAFNEFKQDLKLRWKDPKISTKHKFVEYSKDLKSRKIIDYEKQKITFEVIAKNKIEAKKRFTKMFFNLLKEDVKEAYKKDLLEKKVLKRLKKKPILPKSNQKLIADIINLQQRLSLRKQIDTKKYTKTKYKKHIVFRLNLKFPPKALLKKAKNYKNLVKINSSIQKLPPELVYAIIHSESSFNPMARSYVPAFGLMQIVPKTAGRDAYKYLYNKNRLLTSYYLYQEEKNIKIGTAYLHILYYRYLKNIKNSTSRLFCTIAAYNTGAGNVSKAFIDSTNIYKAAKVINKMTPAQVYKTLMKNLPYNETKYYLKKVYDRTIVYDKLLKGELS